MIEQQYRDPTRTIYARMRALRKARGWSAQDLSHRLAEVGRETSRGIIASAETGRIEGCPVSLLYALAAVFEVPVETLTDPSCAHCQGNPPAGFACTTCGRSS